MTNPSIFKQIVGYVDQLNHDVGQLVVLIEKLMKERGFISLPSARDRICWHASHNYDKAWDWRLPHVIRFFVPEGAAQASSSSFYLVLLETKSAFDFPTIICGRLAHPAMTENEIYLQMFSSTKLKSLAYEKSRWRSFRQERGWCLAEPAFESPIKEIRGYILNLFDIDNPHQVRDNIIIPLTKWDSELDLARVLTVTSYAFPELALSRGG